MDLDGNTIWTWTDPSNKASNVETDSTGIIYLNCWSDFYKLDTDMNVLAGPIPLDDTPEVGEFHLREAQNRFFWLRGNYVYSCDLDGNQIYKEYFYNNRHIYPDYQGYCYVSQYTNKINKVDPNGNEIMDWGAEYTAQQIWVDPVTNDVFHWSDNDDFERFHFTDPTTVETVFSTVITDSLCYEICNFNNPAGFVYGANGNKLKKFSIGGEAFVATGNRESPIFDLAPAGILDNSMAYWEATLNSQDITIETAISRDGGSSWEPWQEVTNNGGMIPGLSIGEDLFYYDVQLKCRQTLETSNGTVTPTLDKLLVQVNYDAAVPDDVLHAHQAGDPALSQKHTLATNALSHGHALDPANVTFLVKANDLSHAHSLAQVGTFEITAVLGVNNLLHAQDLEGFSLSQRHNLAAEDLVHSHFALTVPLEQAHTLSANDLIHGHVVQAATILQDHQLDADSLLHGHDLQAVPKPILHVLLSLDSLEHGHQVQVPVLIQHLTLEPESLAHAHVVDGLVIPQSHFLQPESLHHPMTLGELLFYATKGYITSDFSGTTPAAVVKGETAETVMRAQKSMSVQVNSSTPQATVDISTPLKTKIRMERIEENDEDE